MDFYPFHVGDYRKDTGHLSALEHYIYRTLMDWYYLDEKPLPDDDYTMLRRLRLDPEPGTDSMALQTVLKEFFKKKRNCWHHGRIDHELLIYKAKRAQQSAAGKASGRKRKEKSKGTIVERPLDSGATIEQPTKNQEPRTSSVDLSDQRTGKINKRFVPPSLEEVKEYWNEKKLNGDPGHFVDHFTNCDWKLSGGRGAKMKKWQLAANNWSRNQPVFNPKEGSKVNGKLVLPKNRDGWHQFATIHNLPQANAGESFEAWEGRLTSAIEKQRHSNDS